MKFKYFLLTNFFAFIFLPIVAISQVENVTILLGDGICGDGEKTTTISISVSDTNFYVLYKDGQQVAIKQNKNNKSNFLLKFGKFSEHGVYTSRQYSNSDSISSGGLYETISGEVMISEIPELIINGNEFNIVSGELFSYMPESIISSRSQENTGELSTVNKIKFIWTAELEKGKLKNFSKKGKGGIVVAYTLQNDSPVKIKYTITPFLSNPSGDCYGKSQNIFLTISKTDL
jgi:hypothetical protein